MVCYVSQYGSWIRSLILHFAFCIRGLYAELLHVPDRVVDPALAGGVIVGRQTHPGLAVGQGQAVDTVGVDVVLEGHPRVGQGRGVEEGVLDGHRAVVEGVPDEGGGRGLVYVKLHREVVRAVGVLAGVAAEGVDGAAVGEGIGGDDGVAEDGGGGAVDALGGLTAINTQSLADHGVVPERPAHGGAVTARREARDEDIVGIHEILVGVLADVLDRQGGLDQRGIVEGVLLDGVAQDEDVQTRGEVLERHGLGLPLGEELVAAAGADDDGAAGGDIQLGVGIVDVGGEGTVGITGIQNKGFGSHGGLLSGEDLLA